MSGQTDWEQFVASLSLSMFRQLSSAVRIREIRENSDLAKGVILSDDEIALIQDKRRVAAIKSVRSRCGIGLMAAKAAVDNYEIGIRR